MVIVTHRRCLTIGLNNYNLTRWTRGTKFMRSGFRSCGAMLLKGGFRVAHGRHRVPGRRKATWRAALREVARKQSEGGNKENDKEGEGSEEAEKESDEEEEADLSQIEVQVWYGFNAEFGKAWRQHGKDGKNFYSNDWVIDDDGDDDTTKVDFGDGDIREVSAITNGDALALKATAMAECFWKGIKSSGAEVRINRQGHDLLCIIEEVGSKLTCMVKASVFDDMKQAAAFLRPLVEKWASGEVDDKKLYELRDAAM